MEKEVVKLVKDFQGYVANSEISVSPGSIRTGSWKARIPLKEFDPFREAVLALGEVEKNAVDSQDMTEEYYDLESQIKNWTVEEEALRKIMEKASDKMENFLAVREAMVKIRREIDQKQGRLRLVANLTDLTTVTITVREKQKYVPEKGPEPAEIPTFGKRIGKTFSDSAGLLVDFFQGLVVFLVALVPWSPFLLGVAICAWVLVRRRKHVNAAVPVEKTESVTPV